MDAIRNRLEQDLKVAVSRLRQLGGVKALEDLLGPSGEHWSFADEVDEIRPTSGVRSASRLASFSSSA